MHIRRGYVLAGMGVCFPLLIALQVNLLKHVSDPSAKQAFANLVHLQMYAMITSILVGIHYYLYRKLIAATFIHKDHPKALYIFLLVSALSTLSFFLSKFLAAPETPFLVHLAFTSFGWSVLTVFSFWVSSFLFWLGDFFRPRSAAVLTEIVKARRKALFALALSSFLVTLGAVSAAEAPAIIRTQVYLPKFPCEMNGFTIVQISDTHLGNTFPRAKFVEIVNRINELKPDLVALTGDLVDAKIKPSLLPILEPFGWLNTKYGTYYVTGNHEYMTGSAVEWMEELQKKKIHVLHNSHEVIQTEKGSFVIAGVDDIAGTMVLGHGPQFDSALANIDKTKEVILLAHQPVLISEAADKDVGLVLSGHTHGGQIWPFGYLVKIAQPYLEGLHTHVQGNSQTQIYVSRGTGWWGPPIRLFAPAEITHHTLYCKNV